jgi:hypothetical protein
MGHRSLPKIQIFIILFIIKTSTVLLFNYLNEKLYTNKYSENTVFASLASGDSEPYIIPIENFIQTGEYYFTEDGKKEYAGRAPYYGSIYYFFRLFSNQYVSLDLLAMLQIILECFAGIALAAITLRITKSIKASYITLLLFSLSTYQTDYDARIITESISASALIFFAYYFLKLFENKTPSLYFVSGFWLGIAVLLKPYFAPLFVLYLVHYDRKRSIIENLKFAVMFGMSIILFVTPFTIRNYLKLNKIQPFSSYYGGAVVTEGDLAFRNYLQSIGESIAYWDPDCAACHFTNAKVPCYYVFPSYVYTENTDSNDIKHASQIYIDYLDQKTSKKEKEVIKTFSSLTSDFKQSRPFIFYLGSRLLLLKKFLIQKASYYIANPFTDYRAYFINAFKGLQYILYYFITIGGLAGIIYFIKKNKQVFLTLGIIPVYLIIFFPVLIRATEWRYWSSSHYFLLVSTVCFIYFLLFSKKIPGVIQSTEKSIS